MARKDEFSKLVKSKGYKNVTDFCYQQHIDVSNMSKRLLGTQKIELSYMFKIANMLQVPIDTIIEIFYTEEMQNNRENIEV